MTVVVLPAVTSRDRNALTGIGLGLGLGEGAEEGDGVACAVGVAVGVGLSAATTSNQTGRNTRSPRARMKAGNDTRRRLVTPAATGWTTPSSAPGSAIPGRERRGVAASTHASRRG